MMRSGIGLAVDPIGSIRGALIPVHFEAFSFLLLPSSSIFTCAD